MNGDLRVAYRASREGPRDIMFIPSWFTNCEVFPDLPSMRGWIEAMTSLGRLIFFDQPGTGASDPVTCGRAADTGAMGRQHHRSARRSREPRSGHPRGRRRAGDGDAIRRNTSIPHNRAGRPRGLCRCACRTHRGTHTRGSPAAMVGAWGTGEMDHVLNPDMPWNEEIRATSARMERLAASPGTVALMMPLLAEMDVRELLPTVRVPTLVVQHADDPVIPPEWGKYVADHIPGAKYVELPGRNMFHFGGTVARVLPGDRRVPHRPTGSMLRMIGFSPPCCSPTS